MKQTVEQSIGNQIIAVATIAAILEAGDRAAKMQDWRADNYIERAMELFSKTTSVVIKAGE